MRKPFYFVLVFMLVLVFNGAALAECNCRQPAYMDEIDFLTRYTQCLERCFTSQLEQLKLELDESRKKVGDLESQINQLNLKITGLKDELTSVKGKKK